MKSDSRIFKAKNKPKHLLNNSRTASKKSKTTFFDSNMVKSGVPFVAKVRTFAVIPTSMLKIVALKYSNQI